MLDDTSLRSALRTFTSTLHQDLDAAIGPLDTVERYRAYLAGTWRFRSVAEGAVGDCRFWEVDRLTPLLELDLEEMSEGGQRRQPPGTPDLPDNVSAYLGALYVLEGSSVGARMLCRDAAKLGYGPSFGARHLHRQCEDRTRWPRFLEVLEQMPDVDREAALASAERTFRLAHAAYLG